MLKMKKIIVLALLTIAIGVAMKCFAFSDDVKKEAEKFVKDLNRIGLSENANVVPVAPANRERLEKKLKEFYESLPYDDNMMLKIAGYFYSKNTPQYNLLGQNVLWVLCTYRWEKNLTKQEILIKKLLPLLADKKNPLLFRIDIIGTINSYFDKGGYVNREFIGSFSQEQRDEFLSNLGKIVFDKDDDVEIRRKVVPLQIERFQMNNKLLKNLLSMIDDIKEDELFKKAILNSIHTALIREKIDREGKNIIYSKTMYIIDNNDKYERSVVDVSFKILHFSKDDAGINYLYSLMLKTNDVEMLERARYWYSSNYFVFMNKGLESEYRAKAREVLKQRIQDKNLAIRRFCIEELIKDIDVLDTKEKKELKELFLKTKQKEKNEELTRLLDKGIEALSKEITS